MGTRITLDGAEKVYQAAQVWAERALLADDSLFTPGKAIWSPRWLGGLHERFLDHPDESKDSFLEKLQRQLADSPPEVYQLMGEALYFYFLIVITKNSADEQRVIDTVLGWSPTSVTIPAGLVASLTPGIVNPGTAFHTYRPYQVGFLIEFVEQWKEREPGECQSLLDDPWAFKDFLTAMHHQSPMLRDNQNKRRIQRQALLHLLFPDTFEAIVAEDHKILIAKKFSELVTQPTDDVDRKLEQIRPSLEAQYGSRNHFFFDPPIRVRWDDKYKPDLEQSVVLVPQEEDPPPPPDDPWAPLDIELLAEELLWEPNDLQKIVDGLKDKRQAIFQGPPGTGKTYVAKRIAEWCREHGGDFRIVQFHPSYSYEDFVEGFRPTLTESGQAGFKLTQGPLRRIAEKAEANPDATFILVIDEINRGNVAKVLGELYFVLEYRDEKVELQYSSDPFSLPKNLWFIGTMNTTDRSIALVDAALRRRFYFFGFFPDEPPLKGLLDRWLEKNNPEVKWVAGLVDLANRKLKDRHLGIGPSHFMKNDPPLDENRIRFIWEQAVIPYIEEQCFGDEDKLKEFVYDRLKREFDGPVSEPDAGSGPPESTVDEGKGQPEDDDGHESA